MLGSFEKKEEGEYLPLRLPFTDQVPEKVGDGQNVEMIAEDEKLPEPTIMTRQLSSVKQSMRKLERDKVENLADVQQMILQNGKEVQDNLQPFFVQMPSSLPFEISEEAHKIGKMRFLKSGKVVLRVSKEDGSFVDLEVSKGI